MFKLTAAALSACWPKAKGRFARSSETAGGGRSIRRGIARLARENATYPLSFVTVGIETAGYPAEYPISRGVGVSAQTIKVAGLSMIEGGKRKSRRNASSRTALRPGTPHSDTALKRVHHEFVTSKRAVGSL